MDVVVEQDDPQTGAGEQVVVGIDQEVQTRLPDWRNLSFGSLPPIATSGAINVNGIVRQWQAGMRPSQYLHLSDIDEALGVGKLSLAKIADRVGLNVGSLSLDVVPLIKNQSLSQLVGSMPGLGQRNPYLSQPIGYDLPTAVGTGLIWVGECDPCVVHGDVVLGCTSIGISANEPCFSRLYKCQQHRPSVA